MNLVMLLMTDGANEQAVDYPGYWGCSDTSAPGRQQSPDRLTLDQSMLSWCQAIREDYKVELYTVAIIVSDTNAVNLLRTCAGDSTRAFAVDAGDLAITFAAIARETFELASKNSFARVFNVAISLSDFMNKLKFIDFFKCLVTASVKSNLGVSMLSCLLGSSVFEGLWGL